MRQGTPRTVDGGGGQGQRGVLGAVLSARPGGPEIARRGVDRRAVGPRGGLDNVRVNGQLTDRQRDVFRAAAEPDRVATALMHRRAAAQVRQRKRGGAIAAIGRAEQVEQRRIVRNGD